SAPSRAAVIINGTKKGLTPLNLKDLNTSKTYTIEVIKSGHLRWKKKIKLNPNETLRLETSLQKRQAVAVNTQEQERTTSQVIEETREKTQSGSCTGQGAKLSVMPVGVANCEVLLSGTSLGVAPFFKMNAPTGQCKLEVNCPDGAKYTKSLVLNTGDYQKIIIRQPEWQN
ncbi:MAG: PEGA domain-containing protein, partial [Myxococcota bacterium]|nr:PEGA domain-containing protein [Myxococcota bacterium]